MTNSDIRELTNEELTLAVEKQRREILDMRIKNRMGQLEKPSGISLARKDLARLLTEQTVRAGQAQ
jgi:ribosomal protein L29